MEPDAFTRLRSDFLRAPAQKWGAILSSVGAALTYLLLLILLYLFALPPLLAKTVFRSFFMRMGFIRFFLLVNLIQFMAALPIKMVLRWTLNLKYIVFIPEAFFNI